MAVPRGVSVYDLFCKQVRADPQAIALDGPADGEITYQQLHARALRIASALQSHGIGTSQGQVVATCLEPSTDTVATFLAVMSLGASYCPLDPTFPATRLEFIVQDSAPALVITERRLLDKVPPTDVGKLLVEDVLSGATGAIASPLPQVSPDSSACLLYTSGSTGKPKGALVPHRGIVRLIFGMPDVDFGPDLRVIVHSPLGFDVSTFEIFGPLLHGGTAVLFPSVGVPTLAELRDVIRKYRVNCLFFGPAPMNMIVDEQPDVLEGLEMMIVGGEAMSAKHTRKCQKLHPKLKLINGYGPTEATTFASTYAVPTGFPEDAASVPIGKPLGETTYYLVDEEGREITGEGPGELLIGGDGVALGYLNRPEMTAEKFIANRFRPGSTEDPLLYRTGDLCRRLPDGNYDYIGRMDSLVKISGLRIELGEIEAAIAEVRGVSQAAAVVRQEGGSPRIAAYFTALPGQAAVASSEVRDALAARLPKFMVPTWIVPLDHMPVTPSGKVDRRSLPAPSQRAVAVAAAAANDGPLERELVAMWREVLRSDLTSAGDDFFQAGGTSLAAMRLCAMIERRAGVFVPVASLYDNPTARGMAEVIRRLREPGNAAPPKLVMPFREGDAAPLFCIPGEGGNAMVFGELAKHFPDGHPVLGLNYPGSDGSEPPLETIESIAARHADEIRRVAPAGPRRLLGYSMGGLIALELARQFQAAGEPFELLVLLDSFLRESFRHRSGFTRMAIRFARDASRPVRRLMGGVGEDDEHALASGGERSGVQGVLHRVTAASGKAFARYDHGTYDGPTLQVMARDVPAWSYFRIDDPTGGWHAVIAPGQLQSESADGTHASMLRQPRVAALAQALSEHLCGAAKP